MKKLVRLWKRPCKNGQEFKYSLIWYDEQGKEKWQALGHSDARKAERQRTQKERELRMGIVEPGSMKLSEFLDDILMRTRRQVRESTLEEYTSTMKELIQTFGDLDYRSIQHQHGEKFIQACLDRGNRVGTVRKKIGTLKRMFQLAVERGQLEENPFRYVRKPKAAQRAVHVFRDEECIRMINIARDLKIGASFRWDMIMLMALCTGMRRGELLNTTWADIDFEKQVVHVTPKEETEYTWKWHIKDTDRRTLPLTDEVVQLLTKHQVEQPEGYPYVFIPPDRYERIQKQRQAGKWTERKGKCPMSNFQRQFKLIQSKLVIKQGEFHDFRRTCLTNWLANGLSEFDVMNMAGHASFQTTHKFYLAVRKDLIDRTRQASTLAMKGISIANPLQVPSARENKKGCQPQVIDSQDFTD